MPFGEAGADVADGLGGDLEVAHLRAAGESEAGHQGDADTGADQGAHEAVVAGTAGGTRTEAAEGGEHVGDVADLAPPLDPAVAGDLGQADRRPAGQRVACGNQQPEMVSHQRDVAARTGGGRPGARRLRSMEVIDEREIGPAVSDRTERLIWLGLDHGDLDGVPGRGRHGGQGGREQRLPGAGKRDHGQGLRPVGRQGAQLLRGCLQLSVDRVGSGEQDPAGVGERDAARAASDERHAGTSLEGGDLLGRRRRRVVQHRSRPSEAARARDFPQHGEAVGVDQQFS